MVGFDGWHSRGLVWSVFLCDLVVLLLRCLFFDFGLFGLSWCFVVFLGGISGVGCSV